MGECHLLVVTRTEVLHVEYWSLNSVGLACSCLPVREYGTVVALHAAVCDWLRNMVEDGCLINLLVAHEIKTELLRVETSLQEDCALVNLDTLGTALRRILFSLVERANPDANFDVVVLILGVFE